VNKAASRLHAVPCTVSGQHVRLCLLWHSCQARSLPECDAACLSHQTCLRPPMQPASAPVCQAVDAVVAEAAPGGRHERTLVVVLGDHGQTAAGEHGGGTPAEAHTVLLALSAAALHRRRSGYAARPARTVTRCSCCRQPS